MVVSNAIPGGGRGRPWWGQFLRGSRTPFGSRPTGWWVLPPLGGENGAQPSPGGGPRGPHGPRPPGTSPTNQPHRWGFHHSDKVLRAWPRELQQLKIPMRRLKFQSQFWLHSICFSKTIFHILEKCFSNLPIFGKMIFQILEKKLETFQFSNSRKKQVNEAHRFKEIRILGFFVNGSWSRHLYYITLKSFCSFVTG